MSTYVMYSNVNVTMADYLCCRSRYCTISNIIPDGLSGERGSICITWCECAGNDKSMT